MKRKIGYISVAAAAFIATGCHWLDKEPLSQVTPDQYFTNESAVLSFVDGRYTEFLSAHGGWSSVDGYDYGLFQKDATTDDQISASGPGDKYLGLWLVPQTGGGFEFSNIYKINWFLNQIKSDYEAGEISGSKTNIDRYIGEAYFLRAWAYFSKLQSFGDYPIVTEPIADKKEDLVAASVRKPRNEVARFILSDLDKAIELMGTTQMANTRIGQKAAYLLKSRVALFEGSWLKNFAGTAFVPGGPEWPGESSYQYPSGSIESEYGWFFEQAMVAAREVADNTVLTENTGTVQQSAADPVNPYMDMFGTESLLDNSEAVLWCQYASNLVGHSVVMFAQRGNNGTGLTRGLIDSYLCKDGLPIYASPLYGGDQTFSDVRTDRDTRLSCFLKEPGQKNWIYPTTEANQAIETEPVPQFTGATVTYCTGYSTRKGNSLYQKQAGQRSSTTGCIVMRGAEALLNYIEACYELNGSLDTKAEGYWKALRRRAGVDEDFNKTVAATVMSREAANDWGAYTAGQLVDAMRYNIRRERRNEFMVEGLRWTDLVRWRALDQLVTTPYAPEGIHIWSDGMQTIYKNAGIVLNNDGSSTSNVSSKSDSEWLRPYQFTPTQLGYNGLGWKMAYYLSPISAKEFLLTSKDGKDKDSSPLYQNPYWSKDADTAPLK